MKPTEVTDKEIIQTAGSHHGKMSWEIKFPRPRYGGKTVITTGTHMGCGLCQMSGFYDLLSYTQEMGSIRPSGINYEDWEIGIYNSYKEFLKSQFDIIFSKLIELQAGAVIATLGQNYLDRWQEVMLTDLGFKEISMYDNPMHSGGAKSSTKYNQKLFIKILSNPK